MDRNGIIGKDYTLPWRLSSDLKYFKAVTMGKPIVMGRKTHESIGRPLPGRDNVVLSRETDYQAEGCTVLNSLEDVYKRYADAGEVMIMGGADLYEQTLDKATRIYLTKVHAEVDGDTWFPKIDWDIWEEVGRQDFKADARNEYDYSFVILERNNA
jgi:dihydrofolate reductase